MTAILFIAAAPAIAYEIQGEGYFRLESPSEIVYARSGSLSVADGFLVHSSGLKLSPPVRVPADVRTFEITPDGFVIGHASQGKRTLSQLVLAKLAPGSARADGDVLRSAGGARPTLGNPGDPGFGVVVKRSQRAEAKSAVAPATGTGNTIRIREVTEINTATVTLGQVADVSGPLSARISNLSLGASPRPGAERPLTEAAVLGALRSARIEPTLVALTIAPKAIVRRAARMLEVGELDSFATSWVASNLANTGPLTLATQIASRKIADGALIMSVSSYRDLGTALVLTLEGSVDSERQFLMQLVYNKSAKATANGTAFLVKKGQQVRVVLASNGITVETMGKCQSNGAVGETVAVLIETTKATVNGIVQQDGSIEVKL